MLFLAPRMKNLCLYFEGQIRRMVLGKMASGLTGNSPTLESKEYRRNYQNAVLKFDQ